MTRILVLADLFGCTYLGPTPDVVPSGSGVRAAPKRLDRQLDFVRTKINRPYDELAALHVSGYADRPVLEPSDVQVQSAMGQLEEAMLVKACELGADAVIVTQDFSPRPHGGAFMNGIAIKYRPVPSAGG